MKYIITTIAAVLLMMTANAQEAQLKPEVFFMPIPQTPPGFAE